MDVTVVIEEHSDRFVAYPLGLKGIIVADGGTYEEALSNVESATCLHIEAFGPEMLEEKGDVTKVFIADSPIDLC